MPFARYLLERRPMQQSHNQAIGRIGALTGREQQVAKLAKSGLSNKGIAKSLGLSEGTVKHHLHRVFQKLRIRRRSALQQPKQKSRLAAAFQFPVRRIRQAAKAEIFCFLRRENMPSKPRPPAKSGSAAGSGVVVTSKERKLLKPATVTRSRS